MFFQRNVHFRNDTCISQRNTHFALKRAFCDETRISLTAANLPWMRGLFKRAISWYFNTMPVTTGWQECRYSQTSAPVCFAYRWIVNAEMTRTRPERKHPHPESYLESILVLDPSTRKRNSSGFTLDPSNSSSAISSSMYTCQWVVSITYHQDMRCEMARAPLISYIPSMFCGTVKAFAPYPTPNIVHLSTSPVDKSSPVNYNDMMRENTSNPLQFLPSVETPLWKPLHENPSLLIHPIELLLCHRSSRYLTFTVV